MITFWWKIMKTNMFSLTITGNNESCTVSLETFIAKYKWLLFHIDFCICREPHTLIQKASAAVTAVNPAVLKEAIWDRRVFRVFFLPLFACVWMRYHLKSILFDFTCVQVGDQWVSPHNRCVWSECVQVNEEVFIQHTNVSCHLMDTPSCPLGTELQCNNVDDCCPTCHCGTNSLSSTHKLTQSKINLKG